MALSCTAKTNGWRSGTSPHPALLLLSILVEKAIADDNVNLPSQDIRQIFGVTEAAQGISFRDLRVPATITTSIQGTAQQFQPSVQGMYLLLVMAILVIYIVLGILYESFFPPLTILSGLPSAGAGALLTLLVFMVDLSVYAFVGIIMLIGIVKKNAIMMIDFALSEQRTEGKKPGEAIFDGCILRFRPIMMTTMAAFMGIFPIALGLGAGAEARRPLGLAVVGGLVLSQLLTLYITPVVNIYMEWAQNGLRRLFRARKRATAVPGQTAGIQALALHS